MFLVPVRVQNELVHETPARKKHKFFSGDSFD
jgi:hypothetical protein